MTAANAPNPSKTHHNGQDMYIYKAIFIFATIGCNSFIISNTKANSSHAW